MQEYDPNDLDVDVLRLKNLMLSESTSGGSSISPSSEMENVKYTPLLRSKRVTYDAQDSNKVDFPCFEILNDSEHIDANESGDSPTPSWQEITPRRNRRRKKKSSRVLRREQGNVSANDNLTKYKTEMCIHWSKTGDCSFGNKCLYSHGQNDLRARKRCGKFRTETCSDPARVSCGTCTYVLREQNRCNFAHPGDAIRVDMGSDYYDREYENLIKEAFPDTDFPFGVYI